MPYPYNYTKLWEPIQINGMKLRNRISLSPMALPHNKCESDENAVLLCGEK